MITPLGTAGRRAERVPQECCSILKEIVILG